MQRSTATFLLFTAVLAAAALLAWGWFDGDPAEPGEPAANGTHAPAPSPSPTSPTEPRDPSLPHRPGAELRVRVEVRAKEKYAPPPSARVRMIDALGRELPAQLLAGAGAGFAPQRRGGPALVRTDVESGTLLRQVEVPESDLGTVTIGARIVVRGAIVDLEHEPIAGARVWLGESTADGLREAVTDEQGRFELDTPAGAGVPFVARAEGRASHWQAITVEGLAPEFSAVLGPSAQLSVRLATTSDIAGHAAVYVVPQGDVTTEVAHYPFFWPLVVGPIAVDESGGALIADLPAAGTIGVVIHHPRVPLAAPTAVALKPGPLRVVVPVHAVKDVWRGRVVDENGTLLGDVAAWSRLRDRDLGTSASMRFQPPHLDAVGSCFVHGGGAFEIGGVAADAVLSLRAPGRAGRDLEWSAGDAPIVLPAWRGGEPSFHLSPPKASVPWSGECSLGGGIRAELAADQPWIVSFPEAGRFDVELVTTAGELVVGTEIARDVVVTGAVELRSPRAP